MIISEATSFGELFDVMPLLIYLGVSLINACLLMFSSSKFMLALQQCGYKRKEYTKWLNGKHNPYKSRLMILSLLGLLFFGVLSMTFASLVGEAIAPFMGFIAYVFFTLVYINTEKQVNDKLPLKKTKRMVRLAVTFAFLILIITFGLITLVNYVAFLIQDKVVIVLRYCLICITPILAPWILLLAYFINEPFEKWNNNRYITRTKEALAKSSVIKIGITGSFAKTSVKNILTTILSQKFRVLATPESYNTPLGISLTVNKLDSTHDVFIAEMGARQVGDIQDLASIVKPEYAILTGVNSQHLETFKTEENIKNTKFELFESLDEKGMGFFSSDSVGSVELYEKFNGEKYLAGAENKENFVYADKVELTENGINFELLIKGEKPIKCRTTLLGRHNLCNICLASAVAYKLGVSKEEIALGITRLSATKHRLELIPNNKNIYIIDDSYNSNIDGTIAAMEVLKSFSGRKIVVTPGLIELGKMENLANMELGKRLAEVADIVIVIGKHNAEMLIKGLFEGGKTNEEVFFAKNLEKGNEKLNEIVKAGDVVLFENDLPDTYN